MVNHILASSYRTSAPRGIRNLAWGILATLLSVFWTAISALLAALFAALRMPHAVTLVSRGWGGGIIRVCGIKVHLEGLENIAGLKSYILVANHQSFFDIFALAAYLPGEPRFVAKKELLRIPVIGYALQHSGHVIIDRESGGKAIRTWGDLGVTGEMASHPIHVYGYQFDTGMAGYFNRVVLHDSGTWNADLKDFDNGRDAKGEVINAGVYILQALAKDPDGIAFANLQYANAEVKQVGLAEHAGGPFVLATPETIWDRTYPIHRFSTLYFNRKPGTAVDPKVKEFIRYILSREGMQAVADDGAYTPINEKVAEAQRHKLD